MIERSTAENLLSSSGYADFRDYFKHATSKGTRSAPDTFASLPVDDMADAFGFIISADRRTCAEKGKESASTEQDSEFIAIFNAFFSEGRHYTSEAIKAAAEHGYVILAEAKIARCINGRYSPAVLLLPDSQEECAANGYMQGCHEFPHGYPRWLSINDKGAFVLNEVEFFRAFASYYRLFCIGGSFYNQDGILEDDEIRSLILSCISPFFTRNISKQVEALFAGLQTHAHVVLPPPDEFSVYIKGGKTIHFDMDNGGFEVVEDPFAITVNRLPVSYDPDATCPLFGNYLRGLFHVEDLATIQEFCGYCLIPSTKAQAALFVKGEGDEGKSLLVSIMSHIFGRSAVNGKLADLEENQFMLAELRHKLLFLDDDLNTALLKETGTIKEIITATTPLLINRKHKEATRALLYSRMLCVGNQHIGAAFDRSDGFYRRQLLVTCKPIPPHRVKDRFLLNKLVLEIPGILNWMLSGLSRLIANGFNFTRSERMITELQQKQLEDNPVLQFVQDDSWIAADPDGKCSSRDLLDAFKLWCENNAIDPPADKTISQEMKNLLQKKLAATYTNRLPIDRCRGYRGVSLIDRALSKLHPAYSFSQHRFRA